LLHESTKLAASSIDRADRRVIIAIRARRRVRGDTLSTHLPHVTDAPPAASAAVRDLRRVMGPPRTSDVLTWLRANAHAGTLACLARAYLAPADTNRIERLLSGGRHDKAVQHFCLRFSHRCFPLGYPWTGGRDGRLLAELAGGIQHEGYGENWEEMGDMWSLKPVFLLSWALMEDPYPLDDEFVEDDDDDKARRYQLCDEAREGIAHLAELPMQELFNGVPPDGFQADHLRSRFTATRWEPLLWAGPWLWRVSGNPFLDRDSDDYPDPEPWSVSSVFRLTAEYWEAVRIMRAIDGFNTWLLRAPAARSRAAVQAALGVPSDRMSTLLDLPMADRHTWCLCPRVALAP